MSIEAGDFRYARARDGSAHTTREQRTNHCQKTSKGMLWMKIRLKDRIRLTVKFFRALGAEDQNGVVAVIREGSLSTILSGDISDKIVAEVNNVLETKRPD